MKLILAMIVTFSSTAQAAVPERCEVNAASAVMDVYGYDYEKEQFTDYDCRPGKYKDLQGIECTVTAAAGEKVSASFKVLMDETCTRALFIKVLPKLSM